MIGSQQEHADDMLLHAFEAPAQLPRIFLLGGGEPLLEPQTKSYSRNPIMSLRLGERSDLKTTKVVDLARNDVQLRRTVCTHNCDTFAKSVPEVLNVNYVIKDSHFMASTRGTADSVRPTR